jgi:hypothetical protein
LLQVACPHCSTLLRAPEEAVGKKVKCGCGHGFILQRAALPAAEFKPLDPPLPNAYFPSAPPPLERWHYAIAGERRGPVNRSEISRLVRSGVVSRETLVWKDGMEDWQPAAKTGLKTEFSGPDAPPPLTGPNAPKALAWTLAVVPLLDLFTLGAIPWWFFFIVNTTICTFDIVRLRKAGHASPLALWVFIVPVYLFVRASKVGQRPDYAYVWILCFVVSFLLIAPIFPVH